MFYGIKANGLVKKYLIKTGWIATLIEAITTILPEYK